MTSKNKKLVILMGISGSGKSVFRDKYVKENPEFIMINMDAIRMANGDVNNMDRNREVAQEAKEQLIHAFAEGHSVIWDNTTLSAKYLRAVYERKPEDYSLEIYYTKRSYYPEECIRDIKFDVAQGITRSNVPEEIVRKQFDRFIHLLTWIEYKAPKIVSGSLRVIEVF